MGEIMKMLLAGLLTFSSLGASAHSALECQGQAISAARVIDSLNFANSDQSSIIVTEVKQTLGTAKIDIAIGTSKNRVYRVKLIKDREIIINDSRITEVTGCFIQSVEQV
jgi:hypothetical protein